MILPQPTHPAKPQVKAPAASSDAVQPPEYSIEWLSCASGLDAVMVGVWLVSSSGVVITLLGRGFRP